MNGAETLIDTLVGNGVDLCFANPGTSEMHFLAALENPRMRSVLCLFEGVATGAADGWYRMKNSPACTLLHLGPGLANGLANLHNARKAGSGIVNIVGEHSTSHLQYDAPLTSDIEGLARPMSRWLRRTDSAQSLATDAAMAVAAARAKPGGIATLILPGETSWGEAGNFQPLVIQPSIPRAPSADRVEHIARVLRLGEPTLIILGGAATRGRALELAGSVAAGSACRLATQFFSARIERGAGRVPLERIPYAVPAAVEFLRGFKHLITVETGEPIAFFSYPDQPSVLKQAGCMVHNLTHIDEDSVAGLEMLRDALGHHKLAPPRQARSKEGPPQGALSPASIAHAISAALPENAILVDESLTTGRETMGLTAGAAPHDVLQNMGGSIGFSTPAATGAALACPDRRVFCMVGDGSAMYTIQSLWTQARESLNVTTIVFANNAYQILRNEFASMKKGGTPGPQALTMMSLENPRIDWVAMGKSMGVPAVAVSSAEEYYESLMASRGETGPMLIEVRL